MPHSVWAEKAEKSRRKLAEFAAPTQWSVLRSLIKVQNEVVTKRSDLQEMEHNFFHEAQKMIMCES